MDLLSPKTIKYLLQKYNAAPLKRLGQNFLINRRVLQKIIKAASLNRGETALEIGPGIGTLTQELAKYARKVIAIEKDRKMIQILKETLKDYKNIEVIHDDILKLNNLTIEQLDNYQVVANLPYNIASPVIRKFLEADNKPSQMILMVQKEVGQRICAQPPQMSLLAVAVQFWSQPKIIDYVSKGCFWPQPKVDSVILEIIPKATPISGLHPDDTDKFFKIVKAGFSSPRKQLAGNLARKLNLDKESVISALKKIKIDPAQRAETLTVEDWAKLTNEVRSMVKSHGS